MSQRDDKIFYNLTIRYSDTNRLPNKKTSYARKNITLNKPIINNVNLYDLCVSKFKIDTFTIPLIIPELKQPQKIIDNKIDLNYWIKLYKYKKDEFADQTLNASETGKYIEDKKVYLQMIPRDIGNICLKIEEDEKYYTDNSVAMTIEKPVIKNLFFDDHEETFCLEIGNDRSGIFKKIEDGSDKYYVEFNENVVEIKKNKNEKIYNLSKTKFILSEENNLLYVSNEDEDEDGNKILVFYDKDHNKIGHFDIKEQVFYGEENYIYCKDLYYSEKEQLYVKLLTETSDKNEITSYIVLNDKKDLIFSVEKNNDDDDMEYKLFDYYNNVEHYMKEIKKLEKYEIYTENKILLYTLDITENNILISYENGNNYLFEKRDLLLSSIGNIEYIKNGNNIYSLNGAFKNKIQDGKIISDEDSIYYMNEELVFSDKYLPEYSLKYFDDKVGCLEKITNKTFECWFKLLDDTKFRICKLDDLMILKNNIIIDMKDNKELYTIKDKKIINATTGEVEYVIDNSNPFKIIIGKPFINDSMGFIDNLNSFCYIYEAQEFVDIINTALKSLFENDVELKTVLKDDEEILISEEIDNKTTKAFFYLNGSRLEFYQDALLVDYLIVFSDNLFKYFGVGFNTKSVRFDDGWIIANTAESRTTLDEYKDKYLYRFANPDYYSFNIENPDDIEEGDMKHNIAINQFNITQTWNICKAILLCSNDLPFVGEYVPISVKDGLLIHEDSKISKEKYNALHDGNSELGFDSALNNVSTIKVLESYYPASNEGGDIRTQIIYTNENLDCNTKLALVSQNAALTKFDISVKWLDIYNNVHDLELLPGCACDIRLAFVKKVAKQDLFITVANGIIRALKNDSKEGYSPYKKQKLVNTGRELDNGGYIFNLDEFF